MRRLYKIKAAGIKVLSMRWNSSEILSHVCLDKHLNNPHYYRTFEKKMRGHTEPTDVHRLEGPSSNPCILKLLEASRTESTED